jgi:hypothetical protein
VVTIIDISLITKIDGDGVGMILGRSAGGPFFVKTVPFPVDSIEGTGTLITYAAQTPADQSHHCGYGHR